MQELPRRQGPGSCGLRAALRRGHGPAGGERRGQEHPDEGAQRRLPAGRGGAGNLREAVRGPEPQAGPGGGRASGVRGAGGGGQPGTAVSGPVGIVGVIFPAFASSGLTNLAFLAALISVSLACMNVLPIPALDGGRWLLIAIYKLRRKELTKETEEKIVSRAFMVLLALIVLVTALDILKFF